MPNTKMEATLFCIHCDGDTDHVIQYKNDHIHQITCKNCGVEVKIDQDYVKKHFKEEFVLRVLTKPVRMTREMERDLTGFLVSLPFRVVTKPYRVYKEFHDKK
ncbi:bh protein [Alkalibacter rhizosphaerae]|uniref:Bh protein n=1 Tax=Alkalibacter rhizosphaerae TaxID=2815577 RepID=A0A974XGB9_9FIRM|nr:bh protein [Alkalibacter rhizosphaerae]QSX08120.1 bh protein [Alkalibacter rhizosphaerae]